VRVAEEEGRRKKKEKHGQRAEAGRKGGRALGKSLEMRALSK
jgi:hypothetical protein